MGVQQLFFNGQVLGGSAFSRWYPAFLVQDGKVIDLGDDEALFSANPNAERIDLEGRTVLPGFIDAHVHPIEGGQDLITCALTEGTTIEDYRTLIDAWSNEHPGRSWIIGGGWSMDAFPRGIPAAKHLDGIGHGRPIFLMNRDGHSAWVNDVAMNLAGVGAGTVDPAGGRIERDENGEPSGAFHELAGELIRAVIPRDQLPRPVDSLRAAQEYLLSIGITAWQDAGIRTSRGYDDAYRELLAKSELVVDVEGAQWLPAGFDDEIIEHMIALRDEFSGTRVSMSSVKIMLDGVLETHTAHLKSPYLGDDDDQHGLSFFDPDRLKAVAATLDALGFSLHFHAVGDAALRQAIDTVAHCREANGWTDAVHHVAHVQVVDQQDLDDMHRVGLAVNAQTLWARLEPYVSELAIPTLGDERGYAQYPFASFLQRGIGFGMGSDWSVSTPRPFHQIHVAVNRRPVPKPSVPEDVPVFAPHERIPLIDAIRAFTFGSATLSRMADRKGSLEPGKDADFVVLDRDVFTIDPGDIWGTEVAETWVSGTRVH